MSKGLKEHGWIYQLMYEMSGRWKLLLHIIGIILTVWNKAHNPNIVIFSWDSFYQGMCLLVLRSTGFDWKFSIILEEHASSRILALQNAYLGMVTVVSVSKSVIHVFSC